VSSRSTADAPSRPDVVVVGGGPSGLACAASLARAGLAVVLFDREGLGGQLVNAEELFGVSEYPPGVSGAEIAGELAEAAIDAGTRVQFSEVSSIRRGPDGDSWIVTYESQSIASSYVVWATGSRETTLSIPNAEQLTGRGISICASCDGPLFAGKDIAVLMANQWSADEVVQLARSARSVRALVTTEADPRLDSRLSRITELPNVVVDRNVAIASLAGDTTLRTITFEVDGAANMIAVDGLFLSLARVPNIDLLAEFCMDDHGPAGRIANDTSYSGLFVVGESRSESLGTVSQCLDGGRAAAATIHDRLQTGGTF
jgi:thioredoxin reductase